MIEVKMMPLLAKRSASHREEFSVAFRPGLTPGAVAVDEGFGELDMEAILAIVNDAQVELNAPLTDGDRLELRIGIAGG